MAFELVEKVELASPSASISFTNIPQDGFHLLVTLSLRSSLSGTAPQTIWTINNSSSGFSWRRLQANGSTVGATEGTNGWGVLMVPNNGMTVSTYGNGQYLFGNYISNSKKSVLAEGVFDWNNDNNKWLSILTGEWNNTAAITSLSVASSDGGNWMQHSSASLYKIY